MTTRHATLAVLTLTLCGHAGLVQAQHDEAMATAAQERFDRGMALYEKRSYAAAIHEFEGGFAIAPRRQFLFAWAQAARLDGDCRTALVLYGKYLATEPAPQQADAARVAMARCPATLEPSNEVAGAVPSPSTDTVRRPAVQPPEPAAPSSPPPTRAPLATPSAEQVRDAPPPRRHRARALWIGLSIGALTLAGLGVGLGVGLTSKTTTFPSRAIPAVDFRMP